MRTLIADDCPITRELLALATVIPDNRVDFAANGAEATDMARRAITEGAHYDLICMDINMPVMGGIEALCIIRGLEASEGAPRATVFMITASTSTDDMLDAITVGDCDDYLPKPIIRSTFTSLLRKYGFVT